MEEVAPTKKFDKWWVVALPAAIIVTIVAIILNFTSGSTTSTDTSALVIDDSDLKIDWTNYATRTITLKEDAISLTESGVYNIYGSLADGSISINVPNGKVKLILNDVSITNNLGPAISCFDADDLVIELVGKNTLSDGQKHSSDLDEDVNGVIYSKADLVFEGEGSLDLTSSYQDGIVSKDDLVVRSGKLNIKAVDDAIRGKDSVYITGGDINIRATADGIKATNDTDAGKGFVYIKDGSVNIEVGDDGIHAETSLIIDEGNIKISKSYEGLEGKIIAINGGALYVKSSDDGINAGSGTSESDTPRPGGMMDADENCILTINGGDIYVNAGGDGIDSNGYVYINGGKTVVDGPTNNGNGALDSGLGFIVNGGEAIAIGSSGMAETFGATSKVNNVSVYLSNVMPAESKIEFRDSANNIVLEHTAAKQFTNIATASTIFTQGETYTLYIDDEEIYTFTINSVVTTNRSQGGPNGQKQGGPGQSTMR